MKEKHDKTNLAINGLGISFDLLCKISIKSYSSDISTLLLDKYSSILSNSKFFLSGILNSAMSFLKIQANKISFNNNLDGYTNLSFGKSLDKSIITGDDINNYVENNMDIDGLLLIQIVSNNVLYVCSGGCLINNINFIDELKNNYNICYENKIYNETYNGKFGYGLHYNKSNKINLHYKHCSVFCKPFSIINGKLYGC